jgi:ubiquinone biosynthesis protein
VDQLVRIDLQIVATLIEEWTPHFPALEEYDARGLLREFSQVLLGELDYSREAANLNFFRDLFANDHSYVIPTVIDLFSNNRVLTEQRMTGRKLSDIADFPKRQRAVIARRIARFVLEPAFERGTFYADPHPGNLFIQDDGSISIIDFGKVGHLSPDERRQVANLFIAIRQRDPERVADYLIELTAPSHPVDLGVIKSEIARMLELYVNVSLEHVNFSAAIGELLNLVHHHRLKLAPALVQFFKALAMCEGMLEVIDPDSSLSDYLEPVIRKVMNQALSAPLVHRLRDSAIDAAELSLELPRRVDRLLSDIERGNLRVWTELRIWNPCSNALNVLRRGQTPHCSREPALWRLL